MSDAAATNGAENADGEEELSEREAQWVDLYNEVKEHQQGLSGDGFMKKLRTEASKATRDEIRDWICQFILKATEVGALTAEDVDNLGGEVDDLKEEVERLGNLTRAIASTNFFALVQRLVALVQERVQDPEVLQTAQIVGALFGTPMPTAGQLVVAAPGTDAPAQPGP